MNPVAIIFFLGCAVSLLAVQRKWAPAALLVGCTYMTLGQGIEVGSINLPVYRLMLLVGLLRVIVKGERLIGGLNLIDKMLIAWSCWAVFASLFHDQERYGIIYACGSVFNLTLIYFLIRIWCTDIDEVREVVLVVSFLLVPIAVEMVMEKATGKNLFAVFGGVSENVQAREGKLRAQGPFLHAILAGTVGATCIPLFAGLLSKYRTTATVGIAAGLVMTFASASSGPVMSLLAGLGALILWPYKQHLSKARVGGVLFYMLLMMVMRQPPYYLMARIDISGGSTGWHRANLIEMTIAHFSEWWFIGTDKTRHWMPQQGIGADPQHTDITNYYVGMGVFAGVISLSLVVGMMAVAFRWVGKVIDARVEFQKEQAFMIWCFGCSLFAHAVTGLSVAYFDQSVLFFWLTIAVVSSSYSILQLEVQMEPSSKSLPGFGGEDLLAAVVQVDAVPDNAEWRRQYRERLVGGETGISLARKGGDEYLKNQVAPPNRPDV